MQSKTLVILVFLPLNILALWPYSTKGTVEICGINFCDCSEPNVICRSKNFTEINFVLPENTDIIDFSRNYIQNITTLQKWPNSIIEINLSRNQIFSLSHNIFDNFTLLENLDLSYNMIGYIDTKVFLNLKSLNSLDLSNNLLLYFDPDWFGTENNLFRLNLAYNYLSKSNLKLD